MTDRIYFSIDMVNNSDYVKEAVYSKSINALVDNQSNYRLAIQSFRLSLTNMPLGIINILQGILQTDPNLTIYKVTLEDTASGDLYQEPVIYIPSHKTATQPIPPSQNNGFQFLSTQNSISYYAYYQRQDIINLINTAFLAAFTALKTAHPGNPVTSPPYVIIRQERLCLITEKVSDGNMIIYLNTPLLDLFLTIPGVYIGTPDREYQIDNTFTGFNYYDVNSDLISGDPAFNHLILAQESNNYTPWTNVQSILITSDSLGIRKEYINGPIHDLNSAELPYKSILSIHDIITNSNGSNSIRDKTLYYQSDNQYKWINLISEKPLSQIDIRVEIQLYTGDTFLAVLDARSSSNIRFVLDRIA